MVSERSGKLADTKTWSFRLIYYYFKIYRARYLKERKDKGQSHSRQNIMIIPCVKLVKTDMSECPCIPPSGCIFLKSEYPIPTDIFGKYISVTSILGNKTYDFVRWDTLEDRLNSYIKKEREGAYYTIKNYNGRPYIYILADNKKEIISVTLIPEDPIEILEFPNCNEKKYLCNPLDEVFPIDNEMLPVIFKLMFEDLIKVKSTAPPELYNNEEADEVKAP